MLPFFLYFIAALLSGFHVYSLLALTLYGVPFNPLEVVSLLGSLGLLIAAGISLFKPTAAAKVALIASLLVWSFYGPAITRVVRNKLNHHAVVSANGEPAWNPGAQSVIR